jgi:hypothetical protein
MRTLPWRSLNRDLASQALCPFLHPHDAQMSDLISLNPIEIEPLAIVGNDQ